MRNRKCFYLMKWLFFLHFSFNPHFHYASEVIMSPMASHITSLTVVYSIIYLGTDKKNIKSSASLAFLRVIHQWPVISPHTGPVTRKMFSFDVDIMDKCAMCLNGPVVVHPFKCALVDRPKINIPSYHYRDPIINIRRSWDCLIFIMGIVVPGKTVFILRRGRRPSALSCFAAVVCYQSG